MTVVQPGRMFVEFGVCGEALLTRRSSVTCGYVSCRETNRLAIAWEWIRRAIPPCFGYQASLAGIAYVTLVSSTVM
jgi:hypothetical protein